jgi:hydroxymethylglutaryl-CoA lyase
MIKIFEVGPRDGLQNESRVLPTQDKVWLIQSLVEAGLQNVESGSFVRADKIPQMADSENVQNLIQGQIQSHSLLAKTNFWYLVPNLKGLERAHLAGVKNIALFTAVSNSFTKKNIGMTVDESFVEMKKVCDQAKSLGMNVRGYISTVWGCPFEMRTPVKDSVRVIEQMLNLGVNQISIGDTIGVAVPNQVEAVLNPVVKLFSNPSDFQQQLAVHFHDTRGTALANVLRSYDLGVRVFDSSIGGLGGCPFAPGASGNLATEDLVYFFKEMGIPTGIDYTKLCQASAELLKRMSVPGDPPRIIRSRALQAFLSNASATEQKKNVWDM